MVIPTGGLCATTSPLMRLFYVDATAARVTVVITVTTVGVAATRTAVVIITIISLVVIIVVVLISVILATSISPEGIGQPFDFFLEGIVDFLIIVDASTGTFQSKFSEIIHIVN